MIGNKVTEGAVQLEFVSSRRHEGAMAVRVSVRSGPGSRSLMYSDVELSEVRSHEQLAKQIEASAGAAAETLCERLGSNLDPSRCAADSLKAWKEIMSQPAVRQTHAGSGAIN